MALKIKKTNVDANLRTLIDFFARIKMMEREQQGTQDYLETSLQNNLTLNTANEESNMRYQEKMRDNARVANEESVEGQLKVVGSNLKSAIARLPNLDARRAQITSMKLEGVPQDIWGPLEQAYVKDVQDAVTSQIAITQGGDPTPAQTAAIANLDSLTIGQMLQQRATAAGNRLDAQTKEHGFEVDRERLGVQRTANLNDANRNTIDLMKLGKGDTDAKVAEITRLQGFLQGFIPKTEGGGLTTPTVESNQILRQLTALGEVKSWLMNPKYTNKPIPPGHIIVMEDVYRRMEENQGAESIGRIPSITGATAGSAGWNEAEYMVLARQRIKEFLLQALPGGVPDEVVDALLTAVVKKKKLKEAEIRPATITSYSKNEK